MVHTNLIISWVFGITGNVISFGLFASSVPTFYRIIKNRSVEEVKPEYYLATTMNCLFWVFIAMPLIHSGRFLILMANGIGLVMNLVYVIIFLLYAKDDKQRMYVGCVLLIELVVISLVSGLAIILAHTASSWLIPRIVGGFSIIFTFAMLLPRVWLSADVLRTKSVESMSFLLAWSNTLNDLCWFIYVMLRFDIILILWFPYLCGFLVGMFQLVLYAIYYRCTPETQTPNVHIEGIYIGDEKKQTAPDDIAPAQVQLQGIVTAN